MPISVIIPSYRNPKYLEFCIKALLENQVEKNEIIVVIDGYVNEYKDFIDYYNKLVYILIQHENQELPFSLNNGVYAASNEKILILNEDNVVSNEWDKCLNSEMLEWEQEPIVYTVNQVEPYPSIYNFTLKNLGTDLETFNYTEWLEILNKVILGPHFLIKMYL